MRRLCQILFFSFLILTGCLADFYPAISFISQSAIIKDNQYLSFNYLSVSSLNNADNLDNPENSQKEPLYLKTNSDIRNNFILEDKSFLEVNLAETKVKLYKDGELIKEDQILTIGDPQGWGGSALGLYKIMSGDKISFSVVSDVYMPYALRYYGKYYLHGEPYYPGGEKLISSISGGCIRLSDESAKDIYELSELNMPVLVIGEEKDYYRPSSKNLSEFPEISARSYLTADLTSGFVFAEKNYQEQLPIASLTKLMTAVVVAENIDLGKSILIRPEMLEAYGVTEGLEAEKRFRVVELFYPLLIESSNDAAEALSYFLGRTKTIKMMNEKAEAMLMNNTKFVDPHGFSIENASTTEDLFQLARYVLIARPPILEITKGKEVRSFGEVGFDIKKMWNKNVFINDPDFVGGKTGFLRESKNNAIFIFKFLAEEEIRNIVIILLGSENITNDTQKVYKWLLENYPLSPVSSASLVF